MTHFQLVGAVHGPPPKQIGHNGRLQDFLTKDGQPGTPPVLISSNGAWFAVEGVMGVDFEHELAFDGWKRW